MADAPRSSTTTPQDTPETASLARTLKPQWVFAIAVGSAVGWGAFILPTDWLVGGGTAGALLGFVIGTALIMVIAVSYGLMIRLLPVTGGALAYTLRELGRIPAFGVGWFLALAYACIVALNASAFALMLRMLLPGVMEAVPLYQVAGAQIHLPTVIAAILVLLLTGWVNIRGADVSGRFQYLACLVMFIAVLAILAAALLTWVRDGFVLYPAAPSGVPLASAVVVTLAFAPWAFVGFDNVPQSAGEFDFSPKQAMRLLMAAILVSGAIYMTMVFATSVAVAHAGRIEEDVAWPTAAAIADMVGPVGVALMVVAVTMGVVTGLNGFTSSAARMMMTMARGQMLPAPLARVSAARGTPAVATMAVIGLCLLAPFFGRPALLWIVDMTSSGVTVAYGVTCLVAYRLLGGAAEDLPAPLRPHRGLLRVTAGAGVVLSVVFLALLFVPGSPAQLSAPPMIALAVWIVLGVIVLLANRRRILQAPTDTVEKVILRVG